MARNMYTSDAADITSSCADGGAGCQRVLEVEAAEESAIKLATQCKVKTFTRSLYCR